MLPKKNPSKKAQFVTAKDGARNYFDYYEDGGKLFCKVCNCGLDYTRKSLLDNHLKSESHKSQKRKQEEKADGPAAKRQKTVTSSFQRVTSATEEKYDGTQEWVSMLSAANIPLSKTNHLKVREFLSKRVKNGGAIPGGNRLQDHYLPLVFAAECDAFEASLVGKNIAVIVDEMSDDDGHMSSLSFSRPWRSETMVSCHSKSLISFSLRRLITVS